MKSLFDVFQNLTLRKIFGKGMSVLLYLSVLSMKKYAKNKFLLFSEILECEIWEIPPRKEKKHSFKIHSFWKNISPVF